MKKILIVSGSLRVGGLENIAMNFCRYSDKNKYQIDFVVYGNREGEYEKEALKMGAKVFHIDSPKKSYVLFYKKMKEIILNNGSYDIVHAHTYLISAIVLKAAKKAGVEKCIAHIHSGKRAEEGKITKKMAYFCLKKMLYKYSDLKCACSMAAGKYAFGEECFIREGIVIPNVIDLKAFLFSEQNRKRIRREWNIDENTFVLGHVGHMLPVKNQLFLLDFFYSYNKNFNSNSKLILVGDGELRVKLENKVSDLNINDCVIFTGTRQDVNIIMSAFDVFVLPSLHEGLPVTLVEAMANGLSYIIEKNVVAEEMLKHENCIIVDGFETNGWISAIKESEKKGRKDSQKCINTLQNYSIEHFRKVIEDLYS